ncbi:hypothetical protein AcW1_005896 [Taiwanofungus camphoratus]|nr:hypothetical protein AcW1_005896 [Antrodia cinnamomea]
MAVEALLSTRAQRAFIGTIVVQAIVVLVMIGITFRFVEDHVDLSVGAYKTLPCYLALFALAEVFELLMAFDALRLRNVIQLIGILCFHGAMMVMAALQVHETRTALVQPPGASDYVNSYVNGGGPGTLWRKVLPFLVVVPIIIFIAWGAMLFFFKQLYHEFGWAIFHVVGANPTMKTMYQYYQILICLLKFDFFAFTGVTMQLLIVVLQTSTAEFGLTIAAIPVTLVLLIICGVAVQREIKSLMSISLVLMLAAQTYFIYKLDRFYDPHTRYEYISTRATLTVFTIATSLLLFATFGVGIRCFLDFDKGLQTSKLHDITWRPKYSSTLLNSPGEMTDRKSSYTAGVPIEPRITIE